MKEGSGGEMACLVRIGVSEVDQLEAKLGW